MFCDFIDCLIIISLDFEMLHNNILGVIEKMWIRVDIEDENE
jgi:hypothetical protein